MIISSEKPSIYPRLAEKFGASLWDDGVIITYGDTVYCKKGGMSLDLHVHEQTHIDQQAAYPGGKDAWWDRYLEDMPFRLEQEIEAYQNQVKYVRRSIPNRRKQNMIIEHCARSMAEMYGGMITFVDAYDVITTAL